MIRFCGSMIVIISLGLTGVSFAQERPDFIPTGMVHTGKKSKTASSEKVLHSFDIGTPDTFNMKNDEANASFKELNVEKQKAIGSALEQMQGKPAQVKKARSWADVEQQFRADKRDVRAKRQEIEKDFTTTRQELKAKKDDCVKNDFYRC